MFNTQQEAHAIYRQAARRFGRAVGQGDDGEEKEKGNTNDENGQGGQGSGLGGQAGQGGQEVWVVSAEEERVLRAKIRLGQIVEHFLALTAPMVPGDMDACYAELEGVLTALGYIRAAERPNRVR